MFGNSNGQIKLRAKQKFKFLSATCSSIFLLRICVYVWVCVKHILTEYVWLLTKCVCVEIREIWLQWFQKNINRQEDGKIYFRHNYEYCFWVCEIAIDWCDVMETKWKIGRLYLSNLSLGKIWHKFILMWGIMHESKHACLSQNMFEPVGLSRLGRLRYQAMNSSLQSRYY